MTFPEIAEKLALRTVGIAGAGGLGSNCAVALARAGIGKLIIADFDEVSLPNLNRQYYFTGQVGLKKVAALKENLARINPATEVVIHPVRLTPHNIPALFRDCDLIIEAFDLAEEKEMLIETVLEEWPGKPIIVGLGMAGYGRNDALHCRRIDNLYICGDESSEISVQEPPLAPRVGIVANMQANTALEILLGQE